MKSTQRKRPTDTEIEDPTFDHKLDEVDYLILKHHQEFGLDYSIVVSEMLGLRPLRRLRSGIGSCGNWVA